MLSAYQQELLSRFDMKACFTTKLVPNLFVKEKYVVQYRNLKIYLSHGMELTKIHRVLSFKQRP